MFRAVRWIAFSLFVCLIAWWASHLSTTSIVSPDHHPKLLVLVVFDQMRGDFLERWSSLYGPDGFNKLTSEGAWFTNCHYPYSMTVTGAGHATLGTGCLPSQHGIIENDWHDRTTGKNAYCATWGNRYRMVPDGAKSKSGKADGGAPNRLLEPALGDIVKEATSGKGKVIGISLKDRGGVLPTGMKADVCYWYDNNTGAFVTSDYYVGTLPACMKAFNKQKLADKWFGSAWSRFRTDLNYADYSGPDDVSGEGTGIKQGRTFPHPMTGGEDQPGSRFYDAVYTSPFGNDMTWAAARAILEHEKLGRGNHTDYLVISFSSNDAVGHVWGPDSQEVLDISLRSDLIMADMIRYLDAHVGRDRYLLALSSDHGICPLPEAASAKGQNAGRIDPVKEVLALELHLAAKFGFTGKWIEAISGAGLYLNDRTIKAAGRTYSDIEAEVAAWFSQRPYVQEVCTRSQMLHATGLSPLAQLNKNSFHPARSGDVMPLLKPYWFISKYTTGMTHGSPNNYDTHVPLLFFGSSVKPGKLNQKVSPQLAAVILAHSIDQKMPHARIEFVPEVFK